MVFTTRAKLVLKKYTPQWLFYAIRYTAGKTILRLIPLLFKYRTAGFTKRTIKNVVYGKNRKFQIIIDPKNGYLDAQVYALKLYESHIVHEFVANISGGDVCIDIGANIGHHTIIMSQCAGATGKVFAYEPIPYIRKQMKESLALNNITNVTIVPDALSDKEGVLHLYINKDNVAGSSFVNTSTESTIPVKMLTLDSYNYPQVDFMKIDVEGFEYNVFLGAKNTIKAHHPTILFEYSPLYYLKLDNTHIKKILTFLKEINYTLIDLEDSKKVINDIDAFIAQFGDGLRSQTNILAK